MQTSDLAGQFELAAQASGLDAAILMARFSEGLSPATRTHPLTLVIPPEIKANLVHPDMNRALLFQCSQMITTLFGKLWADSWIRTMEGIVSRIPLRTETDANSRDFGVTYERSAYFVYTKKNQVIATTGYYQDLNRPDSVFGGLFAVREDYWGTSAVFTTFNHILKTIRTYQKVGSLDIFTSDNAKNLRVQRFYEKNFFNKGPDKFMFRGEMQRTYSLSLMDGAPIWNRLRKIEACLKPK